MRLFWVLTAASAALTLAGCSKEEQSDTASETEAVVEALPDEAKNSAELLADAEQSAAENLAASKAFLEANASKDGVVVTQSGLQYTVLEEGPEDGYSPVSTDLVVVHYVGTLMDGVEFDSSRARGAAATFPLNQVISGWTEGVQLMSEGDRYRFFVPPELAYGENPRPGGLIKPNDALIFDVELLQVNSPERNLETANKFLTENGAKDGIQTTASGLQYEVISKGEGESASPSADNTVKVHYEGKLLGGSIFDSSYARGEPIEFPLNGVIPGWTEGVQLMSEGDKFRFFIPPALAYGERGTPGGPIGPNEALVFEVELIEVK